MIIPYGKPVRLFENTVAAVSADDGGAPPVTVQTIGNHVYFYCDVNKTNCLAAIRAVRDLDSMLRQEAISRQTENTTPIWLHINSPGGILFDAFALADQLINITMTTPIYAVAEGLCASAATVIYLAAAKRYATENTFFLFHQFFTGHWGTYEQFKDEMVFQDMLMDQLVRYYERRTDIEGDKIREWLKRDTWFNSRQAKELGIVREVV